MRPALADDARNMTQRKLIVSLVLAKPVAADDMDDPDMKELMQWAN